MRALQLDYRRDSKPLPWLGLMLLASVLLTLVLLGRYYQDLESSHADWMARIDRLESLSGARAHIAARLLGEQAARAQILEAQYANQVLRQLSLPWNALFQALEDSAGQNVALLSLEPDAQKGTVRIRGEAKNLGAALHFVKQLGTSGVFASVFLQNHEVQQQDPQKPVRFTLVAGWKVDRS